MKKRNVLLIMISFYFYIHNNTFGTQDEHHAAEHPQSMKQLYVYKKSEFTFTEQTINNDILVEQVNTGKSVLHIHEEDNLFDHLPDECILAVLDLFDHENDQDSLLSFMAVCENFKCFVLAIYTKVNEAKHYTPWQGQIILYSSTVYVSNRRMHACLELYNKTTIDYECEGRADLGSFEKLCNKFLHTTLFSETSFLKRYPRLLLLDLSFNDAQTLSRLQDEKKKLDEEFSTIKSQHGLTQSELVLYLHFVQFVLPAGAFTTMI